MIHVDDSIEFVTCWWLVEFVRVELMCRWRVECVMCRWLNDSRRWLIEFVTCWWLVEFVKVELICRWWVECVMCRRRTTEWVMSHTWMRLNRWEHSEVWMTLLQMTHYRMSHVTHTNESCHSNERGMSHIWTRHVTRMNASEQVGTERSVSDTLYIEWCRISQKSSRY